MTKRFDLGGTWTLTAGGRDIDFVTVPGAFPPIGACTLWRAFDMPWVATSRQHVFLVTEGVLARATFVLNGHTLGNCGPWATYRFELPAGLLKAQGNLLQANLTDLGEAFGPMPGRRFECGLPRDIFLELRPDVFLEDMLFHAELNDDHTLAHCTVGVEIAGDTQHTTHILLSYTKFTGMFTPLGQGISPTLVQFAPSAEFQTSV